MDEYIDQFLASSQWTEMSSTGSSPWTSTPANQTGGLLLDPISLLTEDENKNSTTSLFQANHIGESFCNQVLTPQDAAHVDQLVSCNPNYNPDNEFISADSQSESLKKCLLMQQQGLLSNTSIGSMGVHLNNITEVPYSKLSHFPPGVTTKSAGPLTDAGSIGTNGNEFPGFGRTLGDVNSSFTTSLLDPHTTESMIGSLLRKGKLNGLEGDLSGLNGELLQKGSGNNDQQFLMENISVLGNVPDNGQFCNFSVPPDMDFSQTPGWQTKLAYGNHTCVSQLQPNSDTGGGSNGAAKQRVRARRGQATDPHSIAERLRREKIAERMKNLQELVPNSNRTDKASMLDEIIEYVKFLQLQVKVLSMSRMGATGAVVPLITETQSESCGSLHLSASASPGNTSSLSDPQDAVACEQEVVKLMESNVTSAMQFLQTKGLCLMPIALACAISGGKRSASQPIVEAINQNIIKNGSSAPATNIMPSSSGSDSTIDNLTNSKKDDATNDGCEKAPSVEPEQSQAKDLGLSVDSFLAPS